MKKRKGDAKREAAAVRAEQRGRDVTQRWLNRAELEAKELQEQLPGLQNTVASLASQLAADQQAAATAAQAAAAQQAEVESMVEGVVAQKKMVRQRPVSLSLGELAGTCFSSLGHTYLRCKRFSGGWPVSQAQHQLLSMATVAVVHTHTTHHPDPTHPLSSPADRGAV